MEISSLHKILSINTYPGRGIAIGLTPDGKKLILAYFIMGRSENSRNRVFVSEGENLRTRAYDDSKLTDPSLIIYYPVRTIGNSTIVTNGDQTDTIFEFMKIGSSFEAALQTREFEPDAPNFTPRISGIANISLEKLTYKLSILKTLDGDPETSLRFFYKYDQPKAGIGHFIHTYETEGNPLPSFEGEPRPILTIDDIDVFSSDVWNSLNKDNKVSLFVRYVDLETGTVDTRITNIHEN